MTLVGPLIAGFVIAAAASAQTCSVADVRGTYLYQSAGMHSSTGSPAQVPARALGLVQFDGSGRAAGRMTLTVGGVASTYDFSEFTIEVNPDCTGRVQYSLKSDGNPDLGPDKQEIAVLDEGARIWTYPTESPGRAVLMSTEFTRLGRGSGGCVQSMVRGTYLMHYDGWTNQQALNPAAPPAFVPAFGRGIAVVDTDGAGTGSGTHNLGGAVFQTALKVGFRVNPDCTGTFTVSLQGIGEPPVVVTGNGDRIVVLQTALPALQYYERISIP